MVLPADALTICGQGFVILRDSNDSCIFTIFSCQSSTLQLKSKAGVAGSRISPDPRKQTQHGYNGVLYCVFVHFGIPDVWLSAAGRPDSEMAGLKTNAFGGLPHPVVMSIRDNKDCTRVLPLIFLLCRYYRVGRSS